MPRVRSVCFPKVTGAAPVSFVVRCFQITDQTAWKEKLFLWFGFEFMDE